MAELTIRVKASVKEAKQSILSLQNAFTKVDNKVNRTAEAFKKLPEALEGTDKAPGVTRRMVAEFEKLQNELGKVVNLIASMNPTLTSATEGIGAYKELGKSLTEIAKIEPDALAKAKTYISELVPEAQKLANVQFKDIAPNGADFKGASDSVTALGKDLKDLGAVFQSTKKNLDGLGSSFVANATILREGGVEFGNNIAATVKAAASATEKQIERAGQAMSAIKGMGGAFSGNLPQGGADASLFAPALSNILAELGKIPEVASKARDELVSFIGALALSTSAMEQKAPVFANMVKAIYGAFAGASENGVGDIRSVVSAFTGLGNAMAVLGKGDTPARISSVAKAIRDMGEAASGMGSIGTKVTDLARGLGKLPAAVTAMSRFTLNNDYPNRVANMGKALKDLNDAAGGIKPDVARAIANMGDGLSQLSKAGIDPEMSSKLQRLGEGVKSFASMVAPSNSLDLQGTASALSTFVKNAEGISTKISDDAGAKLVQLATDISRALLMLGNVAPGVNFESIAQETGALKNILKSIREMFAAGESLEFAQAGASGIAGVLKTLVGDFQGLSVGDNLTAIGSIARQIGYFANGLKGISASDIRAKGDAIESFFLQMNAAFAGKDMSGLQGAVPALQALAKTLQGIGRKNLGADFTEVSRVISEFVTKLSALPDSAVAKFERIAESCNKAWEAVKHLNAAEKALEKAKPKVEAGPIGETMDSLKKGLAPVVSAFSRIKKAADTVKNAIVGIVNEVKKLWKVAGKVASAFGKITKPLMNFLNGGSFKKSGLVKFLSKMGSIIKYRLIRTALRAISSAAKEGLGNLYQYSALLNNMDSNKAMGGLNNLATTALYLKNTLGAALMPVINAVLPILNMLANAFARVANAINAFISALAGLSTFTAAKRQATQFGDALGGAGDKAKELEKTILGFDEINRLNDNNDGAGGGGGGALDYSNMFEELDIPDWIKNIADQIKNGQWRDAAKTLTAELNRLVNSVKWKKLGAKFGKKFGGILDFAATALDTFNWANLGKKLSDAVNGFLIQTNLQNSFDSLGRLMVGKISAVIQTAGNFIAGLNPYQVAKGFSSFATGLLDELIIALDNTPWSSIIDNIVKFLEEIDWAEILAKMREFLGRLDPVAILDGFFRIFSAVPWGEIINSINLWLSTLDWQGIITKIKEFIESDEFHDIIQGFINGIATITGEFGEIASEIAQSLGKAIGELEWGELISEFISAAIQAKTFKLNLIANAISEKLNPIKDFLESKVWGTSDGLADYEAEAQTAGVSQANSYGAGIQEPLASIPAWMATNVQSPIETSFSETATNISATMSTAKDEVTQGWGEASTWFNTDVTAPIGDDFKELSDNITEGFETSLTDTQDTWSEFGTWFSDSVTEPMQEEFTKVSNNMVASFQSAFNTIASSASSLFNNISSAAWSMAQNVATAMSNIMRSASYARAAVSGARVSKFASGGFPAQGTLFIAGESGPEFVGNIGGQTGVMNTDQMAQSVASGNARVETLLVELIRAVNSKDLDVTLDGKSIADSVSKYQRQSARAFG